MNIFFCFVLAVVGKSEAAEYLVGYDGEVYESLFTGRRLEQLATFPRCIQIDELNPNVTKRKHSLFDVEAIDLRDEQYDQLLIDSDTAAIQVHFDLALLEIIEIDEKQQAVEMSIRTTTTWRDCRLDWDNETLRTNHIYVEPERFRSLKIFIPNLRLLEENDPKSWADSEIIVKIEQNGSVTIIREYVTVASCNIEVVMYPFDTQSCNLTFESPFSKLEVEVIQKIREDVETQSRSLLADGRFIPSDTWEVAIFPLGNSTRDKCDGDWRTTNKSSRECLVERAMYRLLCHRHPTYQLVHLMFPALLVSLIASCVFIIPHGSGDKMGLCVTILLSLFIFTQIMYDNMPETGSKLPLISQYYIVCVVLIAISCMFAAIGTVLSSWRWPVPQNVAWILIKLAPCVMVRSSDRRCRRDDLSSVKSHYATVLGNGANASEDSRSEASPAAETRANVQKCDINWDNAATILDRIFFLIYVSVNVIMFMYFLLHGYVPWRNRFDDAHYTDLEHEYQRIQVELQEPDEDQ